MSILTNGLFFVMRFLQKFPIFPHHGGGLSNSVHKNFAACYSSVSQREPKSSPWTAKKIRKLFIDYFVEDKNHTYVPSSPVFLNNDPSLLFVNAGMNQFKSKLMNKTSPHHDFYYLKNAVNSQKCIRISGKHNDLDDVGRDFHHHTFFEMLGNWSFGDYFKQEACAMAWELLTKVYGLPEERLFVTYFAGDQSLDLPADLECRDIWMDIGVPESHILPFGVKENFWDMGDTGPCGPCSEIHYSYVEEGKNSTSPSLLVNTESPELIEVWNLVFMQYRREKEGKVFALSSHNVDTGMGLERLTAILQGTKSNYDTDLFKPIFEAIEKSFNVKPYENSFNEFDTAYRIIADHARMFTVAISDGIFPDTYDAGHIVRKIIRRTAFLANKVMKTHPGKLSAIVPYVAENLAFFPDISKHVDEVIKVVNEEEKQLHFVINRGRKVRNRMIAETKKNCLAGKDIWDLCNVHGLEENIIQDLISEVKFEADWNGYHKICQDKQEFLIQQRQPCKELLPKHVIDALCAFPPTHDTYKYNYSPTEGNVEEMQADILALIVDGNFSECMQKGKSCFIVTNKTNFYANAGGQVSDTGVISSKNATFIVENVHSLSGYVLHEGNVETGTFQSEDKVSLFVDKSRRQCCSCNHTATHLLNAALRKLFPYTFQRSSYVGPDYLRLGFNCKSTLTLEQVFEVEDFIHCAIQEKLQVTSENMKLEEVQGIPNVVLLRGEVYPENLTLVSIGGNRNHMKRVSAEPCCGTHVQNTSQLEKFVITSCKSSGGSTRVINATTGEVAKSVIQNGNHMLQNLKTIEEKIEQLTKEKLSSQVHHLNIELLMKEVKKMLRACNVATDVPLGTQIYCETVLKALKAKLSNILAIFEEHVSSFVPQAVEEFVKKSGLPPTNDSHKWNFVSRSISPLESTIRLIFANDSPVQEAQKGEFCIVVTDGTNFHVGSRVQAGDIGSISNENFVMEVSSVIEKGGHIYHVGWVKNGTLRTNCHALMNIDQDHRWNCSANLTASHLLEAALTSIRPGVCFQSAFSSASCLRVQFNCEEALQKDELQNIEDDVNEKIRKQIQVLRREVPLSEIQNVANLIVSAGEVFPDPVPVVSIGHISPTLTSVKPCSGIHAVNTSELGEFVILTSKSKDMEKVIRATCAMNAKEVIKNGSTYERNMTDLEDRVQKALDAFPIDHLELWDLLREVKVAKNYHEVELPLSLFHKHQNKLSELSADLVKKSKNFVQHGFHEIKLEMKDVLETHRNKRYIVHEIKTFGDGKKLSNTALGQVLDRPAMFFSRDGHNTVICSCSIPKSCTSSTLTAVLWMEPVARLLRGRTRFHSKDPELYFSVETNDVNNVDQAIDVAIRFVKSCLV